jgi:signal transduction histidine kinase
VTIRSQNRLHYFGAVVWVLLTVSLASWWMIFGLAQARQLRSLGGPEAIRLEHVQRMLVWEGISFIGLLVAGGTALVISVRREQARQRSVEAFFMAFTHDLKTALASLQLQAESLSEDLPEAANNPNMARLLKDTLRLGVQLENSLYFAQPEGHLLVEPVSIAKFIERTAADWPELEVRVEGDETVLADARALESVWRNLLQNAVVHGGAKRVAVRIARRPDGRATITAIDDGCGAPAQVVRALGRPFKRPAATSGTGVGLFVSRQLARRMNGDLRFGEAAGAGFTAVLELPVAP